MRLHPMISSLLRLKVAAGLIVIQIALTLAIMVNAMHVIADRSQLMSRPTGIAEDELFVMGLSPDGSAAQTKSNLIADLELVRATPGVINAYLSNTVPLSGSGWSTSMRASTDRNSKQETSTAIIFADHNTIDTLGVSLGSGRNFTAAEIEWFASGNTMDPDTVIITRAAAERLFPGELAIGKMVNLSGIEGDLRQRVVGIIDTMVGPWSGAKGYANVALVPRRFESDALLVVRSAPGQRDATMKLVEDALWARSTSRVIERVRSYSSIKSEHLQNAWALVVIMLTISVCLLAVTALGIVGQASFWVTQRTRQIGVRRALGATRGQILRYFQSENALISCAGIALGVVLAYLVNYGLAVELGAQRLPWFYLPLGAVVVLALGQLAVLAPARRAAGVAPAVATRSA